MKILLFAIVLILGIAGSFKLGRIYEGLEVSSKFNRRYYYLFWDMKNHLQSGDSERISKVSKALEILRSSLINHRAEGSEAYQDALDECLDILE